MTTNVRSRSGTKTASYISMLVGGHFVAIDRDLFSRRSVVLRKAIEEANNPPPTPGTQAPVEFEDAENCSARTFSMYERLFEEGDVVIVHPEDVLPSLIQIHELAWQLKDYTAANTSIDLIIKAILREDTAPDLDHIQQVYESDNLVGDCPLKKLMVDFHIHDPRSMSFFDKNDDHDETLLWPLYRTPYSGPTKQDCTIYIMQASRVLARVF